MRHGDTGWRSQRSLKTKTACSGRLWCVLCCNSMRIWSSSGVHASFLIFGFKSEKSKGEKEKRRNREMTCVQKHRERIHVSARVYISRMTIHPCTTHVCTMCVRVRLCQRSRHCLPMRPGRCDAIRDLAARAHRATTFTQRCACRSMRCGAGHAVGQQAVCPSGVGA